MRPHAAAVDPATAAPPAESTATSSTSHVDGGAHAAGPGTTPPPPPDGQQARPRPPKAVPTAAEVEAKELRDAHDEQLYDEIRACEHWQDVLDIVTDEGPEMSTKRGVQVCDVLCCAAM
jgi:hypothetical protein